MNAVLCCVVCVCVCVQALSALEAHISTHGVLGLPHEAVRAAFGLPPSSSLMSSSKGEALQQATPKYNNIQVIITHLAVTCTGSWAQSSLGLLGAHSPRGCEIRIAVTQHTIWVPVCESESHTCDCRWTPPDEVGQ